MVSHSDRQSIWRGASNDLITFDANSRVWSVSRGAPEVISTFRWPELGLESSIGGVSFESPVTTATNTKIVLSTVASDGVEPVASVGRPTLESDVNAVACSGDGMVVQVDDVFETIAPTGAIVESLSLPGGMGADWSCQPITAPIAAGRCSLYSPDGSLEERVVLDAGSRNQRTVDLPASEGPAPRGLVGTGSGGFARLNDDGSLLDLG